MTVLVCSAELLREGIAQVLHDSDFEVFAAGPSVESILPLIGSRRPKLIVFVAQKENIRTWCRGVVDRFPDVRIAVLAETFAGQHFDLIREPGVAGLFYHTVSRENLLRSLQLLLDGMCILPSPLQAGDETSAAQTNVELSGGHQSAEGENSNADGLSERQITVLHGVLEGESNKMIARRLGITDSTVKVHIKSIFRKTKMNNRVQLALWASTRFVGSPQEVSLAKA